MERNRELNKQEARMGKRLNLMLAFLALLGVMFVGQLLQAIFSILGSLNVEEQRDREYKDYYDKTFR